MIDHGQGDCCRPEFKSPMAGAGGERLEASFRQHSPSQAGTATTTESSCAFTGLPAGTAQTSGWSRVHFLGRLFLHAMLLLQLCGCGSPSKGSKITFKELTEAQRYANAPRNSVVESSPELQESVSRSADSGAPLDKGTTAGYLATRRTGAQGSVSRSAFTDAPFEKPSHDKQNNLNKNTLQENHLHDEDLPQPQPTNSGKATHLRRGGKANLRRMCTIGGISTIMMIGLMVPVGGRGRRDPPAWAPERESQYPFRYWSQDLIAWSILNTDLDPSQQTAAIILQLGGAARELARNLTYQQITQGGVVGGQAVDSVTYLLANLAQNFAPLGEEQRLQAMTELMTFNRVPGESIDALLSRYMTLRFRASQGGVGMQMSWEGYAWLILRACQCNNNQLLQLLHPFQGRWPTDEAEFNTLTMNLRRMGHILEGTPGNVSNQLRSAPNRGFFTEQAYVVGQGDPWQQAADPWQSGSASWGSPSAPSVPAASAPPSAAEQPQVTFYADQEEETDSETASTDGEANYDDPALQGMTPGQVDEHMFFQYQRHKSNWRKHMHKPTRKVRRFLKRRGPKGKGKGKGWSRFSFLAEMGDVEYDQIFFGGKGSSKGKRRSFAKGKGRRGNPIGRDGEKMKCSICNSEDHFRAFCPQATENETGKGGKGGFFCPYIDSGPIGDLIGGSFVGMTRPDRPLGDEAPNPAATAAASSGERPSGAWDDYRPGQAQPPAPSRYSPYPQSVNRWGTPFIPMDRTDSPARPPPSPTINAEYEAQWTFSPPPNIPDTPLPAASLPADNLQPSLPSANHEGLGELLAWRSEFIHETLRASEPRSNTRHGTPAARAEFYDPISNMPVLAGFQQYEARRQALEHFRANQPLVAAQGPAWEPLTSASGLATVGLPPAAATTAQRDALGTDFVRYAQDMERLQQRRRTQLLEQRALRQRRTGERLARNAAPIQEPAAAAADDSVYCAICHEAVIEGEVRATLVCNHYFHAACCDGWVAAQIEANDEDSDGPVRPPRCPICRSDLVIAERRAYMPQFNVGTPHGSEHEFGSAHSQASHFPWWPEFAGSYHVATQLPDGRLSLIVDPGAWTNLLGSNLARRISVKAIAAGYKPAQERMSEPLSVRGVGKGSQHCPWKIISPIATPTVDGPSVLSRVTSPVVEGDGADLPGLLGLRTIESHRGILDTSRRELIFPGPGEVKIILPPGSVRHPLEKAPSGHLVLVVDDYDNLKAKKGGLPEHPVELMAVERTTSSQARTGAESSRVADHSRACGSRSVDGEAPVSTAERHLDM